MPLPTGTDKAWRKWGKMDPYFAVLTSPEYRKESIDQNRLAFMRTDEDYFAGHLAEIQNAFGPIERRRALDFGCGVGRIALLLAQRFEEVIGLDISPAMLNEAEQNQAGIDNVAFSLSDDQLSNASGMFDFVHPYIVLQHIPVKRGMRIAEQLLGKVSAGGVASLHFSIGLNTTPLNRGLLWVRANVRGAYQLINFSRGHSLREPRMQMNQYSLEAILALFQDMGFGKAIVGTEDHKPSRTAMITARRA